MSADTVVFLGPSLPVDRARLLLDADYRPPAQRGDVAKLPASVRRVVLIDGLFHGAPSVWQRELVEALERGVEVFGASSMGALRAVEVERYGMTGHGVVFEWYRDGTIVGDDEVALVHADAELDFRPLSEPLVNVRATLARARSRDVITDAEAASLLDEARRTFYADRSLVALARGPTARRWSDAQREAFSGAKVDQKRLDAISVLERCARTPISGTVSRVETAVRGLPVQLASVTAPADGKVHVVGTHRARTPEATLAAIAPHLASFGITRVADVTSLDRLQVPTACAIRPAAKTLQVSNGKGLRLIDAQVSALMEALELAHFELPPPSPVRVATAEQLAPERWWLAGAAVGGGQAIEWVRGVELGSLAPLWLPASAGWVRPQQWVEASSNGLASGNTVTEATVHGLLEVLERHVLSKLVAGDDVDFDAAECFDAGTSPDASTRALAEQIAAANVRLVLLRVPTPMPVQTFMAVLLDQQPFAGASAVNVGYGAHLSFAIAATRAITEAAQSRLTYIHGAREDLRPEAFQLAPVHGRLFDFFSAFEPWAEWGELDDHSTATLDGDLRLLLDGLPHEGLGVPARLELSAPDAAFAVVKVLVPGARATMPM